MKTYCRLCKDEHIVHSIYGTCLACIQRLIYEEIERREKARGVHVEIKPAKRKPHAR